MASKIIVDQVQKSGGTAFTLPSADGSNKSAVITDGSGALSFATGTPSASNFLRGDGTWNAPAGGLSHYSQWRLNADFTGDKIPITGTLLEAVIAADPTTSTDSPTSSTAVGAPMTYDSSSGAFTFPATGYWHVLFHVNWKGTENIDYLRASIAGTTNDSAYNIFATSGTAAQKATGDDIYVQATTEVLFDVTSISTHKMRFEIDIETGSPVCLGVASGSGYNRTFMTFIKIADT